MHSAFGDRGAADRGDHVLAVRLQRRFLRVVLQIDRELVDAEVLQLPQALDVLSAGPNRQKRSMTSSGTKSACTFPARPCSL